MTENAIPTDVVITAVSGYQPKHMAAWYNSLRATDFKGRTVAIAYNVNEELVEYMKHMGSMVITFEKNEKKKKYYYSQLNEEILDHTDGGKLNTDRRWTWNRKILRFKDKIYDRRFYHSSVLVREHLQNLGETIRYVAFSDARDVIFQSDPFEWLAQNLGANEDIAVGQESITHKDPWNRRNVLKTYGHHALQRVEKLPVCCAGYFAGRYDAMMDFMLALYYFDQTKRSGDQAAFNQLLTFHGWKEKVRKVNWQSPWLLHASSLTADPNATEYCAAPNTKPVFENGEVRTTDGHLFAIVHQYDRDKEMWAYFQDLFGQVS